MNELSTNQTKSDTETYRECSAQQKSYCDPTTYKNYYDPMIETAHNNSTNKIYCQRHTKTKYHQLFNKGHRSVPVQHDDDGIKFNYQAQNCNKIEISNCYHYLNNITNLFNAKPQNNYYSYCCCACLSYYNWKNSLFVVILFLLFNFVINIVFSSINIGAVAIATPIQYSSVDNRLIYQGRQTNQLEFVVY